MKIFEFLNIFDVFRSPIHFRMNNSEKTSTNLGLFLSLIIYAVIIYAFTESDIFYKISPKILTQTDIVKNRPQLISKGKLFAISITDFDGLSFNDPSVFSISINNEKFASSEDGSQFNSFITEKSYHFCNESDVENPQDLYDFLLMNNLCLDEPSFTIEGSFSEPSISYLAVRLMLCQNSSENNNSCKSFEESSAIMKGKYFNLMFFTDTIELKDHENLSRVIIKDYPKN